MLNTLRAYNLITFETEKLGAF